MKDKILKNKVTVVYIQHMRGFGVSRSERDYNSRDEAEAEVQRIEELNEYWLTANIKT